MRTGCARSQIINSVLVFNIRIHENPSSSEAWYIVGAGILNTFRSKHFVTTILSGMKLCHKNFLMLLHSNPVRKMLGWYLKSDHEHVLPHPRDNNKYKIYST
jgi:hypothetical protein